MPSLLLDKLKSTMWLMERDGARNVRNWFTSASFIARNWLGDGNNCDLIDNREDRCDIVRAAVLAAWADADVGDFRDANDVLGPEDREDFDAALRLEPQQLRTGLSTLIAMCLAAMLFMAWALEADYGFGTSRVFVILYLFALKVVVDKRSWKVKVLVLSFALYGWMSYVSSWDMLRCQSFGYGLRQCAECLSSLTGTHQDCSELLARM